MNKTVIVTVDMVIVKQSPVSEIIIIAESWNHGISRIMIIITQNLLAFTTVITCISGSRFSLSLENSLQWLYSSYVDDTSIIPSKM